jgi:hypothetical protein
MKPRKMKWKVWEGEQTMSTLRAKEGESDSEEFLPWGLEDDLATVSCYAAGEVDNLILKRPNGLNALKRLRQMIQSSLIDCGTSTSGHFMVDPTTAVAMNKALLLVSGSVGNLDSVDELIRESTQVAELLNKVAEKAEKGDQDIEELERLRSLCLALSKSALAFEEPLDEVKSSEF